MTSWVVTKDCQAAARFDLPESCVMALATMFEIMCGRGLKASVAFRSCVIMTRDCDAGAAATVRPVEAAAPPGSVVKTTKAADKLCK